MTKGDINRTIQLLTLIDKRHEIIEHERKVEETELITPSNDTRLLIKINICYDKKKIYAFLFIYFFNWTACHNKILIY
jgi:hypothetical protein